MQLELNTPSAVPVAVHDHDVSRSSYGFQKREARWSPGLNALTCFEEDDQVFMLGKVDEGLTIDEPAQAWIDENEDVWSAWIP